MKELQNFIDGFGFGISVQDLASEAYWYMKTAGHSVCILNERYLTVDGVTYMFSKRKKMGKWIAKAL